MTLRKLDTEGRAIKKEQIVFDQEKLYDALYLGASGVLEIIPLENDSAIIVPYDKGWHPVAFKQINSAGTTLPTTMIFGCLGKSNV